MDVIAIISTHLGKAKRVNLVIGGIVLLIGIGMLFIPKDEQKGIISQYGFIVFMFVLGTGMIISGYLKDPSKHWLIKTIRENPGDIYRIYAQHNMSNGYHSSTVMVFILKSGKSEMVQIPKEGENEFILKIKELVPDAEYGYKE